MNKHRKSAVWHSPWAPSVFSKHLPAPEDEAKADASGGVAEMTKLLLLQRLKKLWPWGKHGKSKEQEKTSTNFDKKPPSILYFP